MKKLLFFLLLSCLTFGQNVELLQKLQSGNETSPIFLAEKLLPGYKLLDTSSKGLNHFFYYLPNDAQDDEINQWRLGNSNKRSITLKYKVVNSVYTFSEVEGFFDPLISFWKKEIQPAPQETIYHTYIYKDIEKKLWFTLFPSTKNKWVLRNMSDRSEPW
jgi:hypothetical protein